MIRVVAMCVFRRGGRMLVTEGVDPGGGGRFARPLGGGVEVGERSEEAVVREVREEVGAEVRGVRLLGVLENVFTYAGKPRHEVVFVYEGEFVDEGLYERAEIELREAGWEGGGVEGGGVVWGGVSAGAGGIDRIAWERCRGVRLERRRGGCWGRGREG